MINKRQLGQYYEEQACDFLCSNGLQLIEKNSQFKLGELDLVMRDRDCLVFVEVRFRKNACFGAALSTVNKSKQQRIICAAYDWMMKRNINSEMCEYRFDIFAITGQERQWIKNAFSL